MHWLLLLISYQLLVYLLHGVVCHAVRFGTVFAKFLIVGTILGCVMLYHFYHIYGFSINVFAAALIYAFLSELYIFLFTFVSSSISVSILMNLAHGHSDISELAKEYSGQRMVENRVKRLQNIGFLNSINGKLETSFKGKILVERFNMLQSFFKNA